MSGTRSAHRYLTDHRRADVRVAFIPASRRDRFSPRLLTAFSLNRASHFAKDGDAKHFDLGDQPPAPTVRKIRRACTRSHDCRADLNAPLIDERQWRRREEVGIVQVGNSAESTGRDSGLGRDQKAPAHLEHAKVHV
jgi:hypothetical protein